MAKTKSAAKAEKKAGGKRWRPTLGEFTAATDEVARLTALLEKATAEHQAMSRNLTGQVNEAKSLREQFARMETDRDQQIVMRQTADAAERKQRGEIAKLKEELAALQKLYDELSDAAIERVSNAHAVSDGLSKNVDTLNERLELCCKALTKRDKEVPELQETIATLRAEVARLKSRSLLDYLFGG